MPTDDELGRLLRAADPVKELVDPDAYSWMREDITRVDRAPRPLPRVRLGLNWPRVAAAFSIVALLVFVFVVGTPTPHAAVARTPRALQFDDAALSAPEVLRMTQAALNGDSGAPEAVRHAVSLGWYLHLDQDTTETAKGVISPEVTTFDWSADESGSVTIVAGAPYQANGSDEPIPGSSAPTPGTVLSDMTFSAGGIGAPTAEPPPDDVDGMSSWLTAMGLPDGATGADYMTTIQRALSFWTLTNQQHSAILQLLLHQPDIRILGTTSDRAGRSVVGVSTESTSAPGNRLITLISTTTGRIVGMETVRTAPIEGLPIGSVTSYTIWETPQI